MMMRSDVTDFIVEGRGDFPLDMLRYDECWPADILSVSRMSYETPSHRSITLRTTRSSNVHPERWASFNWKVVLIDSERYGITLDQREKALG